MNKVRPIYSGKIQMSDYLWGMVVWGLNGKVAWGNFLRWWECLHLLIPNSHSLSPLVPSPFATTSLFSVCESVSVMRISSFASYFRFHI